MVDKVTGPLLEQVDQVHAVLGATSTVLSAGLLGKPKSASVMTYGPDGQTAAKHINADYRAVEYDQDGKVAGGTFRYSTHVPSNHLSASPTPSTKLGESTVALGTDGNPKTVESLVCDWRSGTPFHTVNLDLGAVTWSNHKIHAGTVKLSISKASEPTPGAAVPPQNPVLLSGEIPFNNQSLGKISLTHYATNGSGDIHGYTTIDHKNVSFLGDEIVGGYHHITTLRPDQSVISQSKLHYSESGLPTSMETGVFYAHEAEPHTHMVTDYSGVNFDARKKISHGQLRVIIKNYQGKLLGKTAMTFAENNPQTAETHFFTEQGEIRSKLQNDYAHAQFNNHNHVVNSSTHVKGIRHDGTIYSITQTDYDGDGNPSQKVIKYYASDGKQQVSQTVMDYSKAIFNYKRKVMGGHVKVETTAS